MVLSWKMLPPIYSDRMGAMKEGVTWVRVRARLRIVIRFISDGLFYL